MQLSGFLKAVLSCCVCLIIFSSLIFYESWSEERVSLSSLRGRVAVVYAGPTFHDEVVSSVACALHDLGYYVVAYIGNGLHVGGMMVPLSGKRKRSSQAFYGSCVDQWVTITEPIRSFVHNPDLMVFVTYPMLQRHFKVCP